MTGRGAFVSAILAMTIAASACSPARQHLVAPHGAADSQYWLTDSPPSGFRLYNNFVEGGNFKSPSFMYENSLHDDLTVFTLPVRDCIPTRQIGMVRTRMRGYAAAEYPDIDEQPFGWIVQWSPNRKVCVGVSVDNVPGGVPADRSLARDVARTVRPTTYAYFRSVCEARRPKGTPKLRPRVPIPDPCLAFQAN